MFRLYFLISLLFVFSTSMLYAEGGTNTGMSWKNVKQSKKGNIFIVYYESVPFVFEENSIIKGIEVEIIEGFKEFLQSNYGVDISLTWIRNNSFKGVYDYIKDNQQHGIFGISQFSVTEKRKKQVNFSPVYMNDIIVLVTNENVPVIMNQKQFVNHFQDLSPVAIENTVFEEYLSNFQQNFNLRKKINYVGNSYEIISSISNDKNNYGYVDLPAYFRGLSKGEKIQRQNFFEIKENGYGIIFPKGSDWGEPLEEFFQTPEFKPFLKSLVYKYFDSNDFSELLWTFSEIDTVYTSREIALLIKEKEIKSQELVKRALEIQEQTFFKNFFIFGVAFLGVVLVFIINRFQIKNRGFKLLSEKNKEILNQRKQLEELIATKDKLLSIVSHDLKSPLYSLKGFLYILFHSLEKVDDKDLIELAKRVSLSVDMLSELIDNLLTWANAQSGIINYNPTKLELTATLNDVYNLFQPIAEEKKIKLSLTIQNHFVVEADPDLLKTVLRNLISNAIKFTPSHGEIKVQASEFSGMAVVAVSDNGVGIPAEVKDKMFDFKFKYSTKGTNQEAGTGLGLLLCKEFVELNGGTIWLESSQGIGTTFYFTIPFDQEGIKVVTEKAAS
jgi:signal transduction histidine kinase